MRHYDIKCKNDFNEESLCSYLAKWDFEGDEGRRRDLGATSLVHFPPGKQTDECI